MAAVNDARDGYRKACDLITLSNMLRICDMEVVLFGSGNPRATYGSHMQNEALFCSGEIGFAFRGRFALPVDWCMLGYVHETREGSWCHGTELASGMAFTVLPEGVSEFMLSAGTRITLVLAPLALVRSTYERLEPHGQEMPSRQLSLFRVPGQRAGERLRLGYERIGQALLEADDPSPHGPMPGAAELERLTEDHLAAGLSASAEERPQCSRGRRTHYLILQRVEHFMRAHLRRDIYLQEMCNTAGVSERALRYAFDDLLGMSPNRYLSMLRLCTACRSLALADASRKSVKSVALSCGLWDLSRFADSYRRAFGELPRDTLMRTPPREALASYE